MYKIIDKQNMGTMCGQRFKTKEDVRDELRSFHSADVENTDSMDLDTLLDIGDWELVEIK